MDTPTPNQMKAGLAGGILLTLLLFTIARLSSDGLTAQDSPKTQNETAAESTTASPSSAGRSS